MITLIVVEVSINKNPNGWNLADRPEDIQSHAKVYNEEDRVYPQSEVFTDMSEINKNWFISIMGVIKAAYPGVEVFAMGSRFDGIFYEDSDFDVIVKVENDGQVAGLSSLDFDSLELPGPVDIKITHISAPEIIAIHKRDIIPEVIEDP